MPDNAYSGLYLMSGQLDANENIIDGSMFPICDEMVFYGTAMLIKKL
jgi:hypothetical protein